MKEIITDETATLKATINGIEVYHIKTSKFKTNSFNIFFIDNLERERAAKNSLLPAVLRRGCASYPRYKDIAIRLEELYGAVFDCDVSKKGELHIIHFYMEFLSDKYAKEEDNLFENTFGLLCEIVGNPLLENGCFKKEYVELEKDNLKKLIASRVNDKMQYSIDRCYEEMCRNEAFGIYEYGSEEDLDAIKPEDLYAHFRDVTETLPVKVYITGDMDEAMVDKAVEKISRMRRGEVKSLNKGSVIKKVEKINNVTERMAVNQGKLTLGFRTNIAADSPDYYSLVGLNTVLGMGPHSKLFQNVREKASLAYYTFSRLEKFKGLMVVSCGIDSANKDKAVEIILKQLDDIKKGKISDEELDASVKAMVTGVNSMRDSQMQIVDYNLSQLLAGTADSFDQLAEKFKRVGRDDIIRASKGIELDTIYFLTSFEKEQAS